MQIESSWETDTFNRQMAGLLRMVETDMPDEVRKQGRLWGERVMKFTPPKNLAQGRRAVKRDLHRFLIVREQGFLEFIVREFGSKDIDTSLRTSEGQQYDIRWDEIVLNGNVIPARHLAARDARGRIPRRFSGNGTGTSWTTQGKLVVPAAVFNQFLKQKQANVGYAKSGWATGVLALGGKVPKWVGRHIAKGQGRYRDLTGNGQNPMFEFVNLSPWATNRNEGQRIMRAATASRARAMQSDLRRRIKNAARVQGISTSEFKGRMGL